MDECEYTSLYDAEGLDRPFDLEVIVKEDLVDVCVDHRHTLIGRLAPADGNQVFLFGQNADVAMEKVEIRPLVSSR
jgi:hypothetical protein